MHVAGAGSVGECQDGLPTSSLTIPIWAGRTVR
jgi:hypothetical protein